MTCAPHLPVLSALLAGRPALEALGPVPLAELAAAAVDHGIDRIVWSEIEGHESGSALRELLAPGVRAGVARDLLVQRDLQRVATALDADGVPALITKGTALAYTVYRQPWLRPRVDTDLFIRFADLAAAGRTLERCGYVRSDATNTGALVSHQIAFERTDPHGVHHVIDLHWKLANPQIVADALPFDELWRSAALAPALGAAARVPDAVHSVAVACVHRLAHHQGHDRLIWLQDLKLLAASLDADDWRRLTELACSRRIAALVIDGLAAARQHLAATMPEDVEHVLREAAVDEPARVYLDARLTKSDVLLSDLRTLDSWGDRVRLVREHVFPPAAFIRQRYGTRTRLLLPAFYVHRLLTGASRWVRS